MSAAVTIQRVANGFIAYPGGDDSPPFNHHPELVHVFRDGDTAGIAEYIGKMMAPPPAVDVPAEVQAVRDILAEPQPLETAP